MAATLSTCLSIYLLCTLCVTCLGSEKTTRTMNTRVLIIGAGISGLAAAERLEEKGISDYLLLEATDRTGGRIKSLKQSQDGYQYTLELGAGWIHGTKGNPVFDLARENDLLSTKEHQKVPSDPRLVEGEIHFRTENGKVVPRPLWKKVLRVFENVIDDAVSFYSEGLPKGLGNDAGLGTYMYKESLRRLGNKATTLHKDVLQTRMRSECIDTGCHDLDEASLKYIGSYKELEGSDQVLPDGYEGIIRQIQSQIPKEKILLNHVVQSITTDAAGGKSTVECKNGKSFTADHVIVTPSLGYLKNHATTLFSPSLPAAKLAAIQRMGFGTVDKIYIEFENLNFIPGREVGELYLVHNSEESDELPWEHKISYMYVQDTPKANILIAWLTGKQAGLMESDTDANIKVKVKGLLERFLGVPVPLPKTIIKTTWQSEPYVMGSYSYVKVGSSVDDIKTLAKPILQDTTNKPLIQFGGEATHDYFYSTTHGALLAGQREADRIHTYRKTRAFTSLFGK